MTPRTTSDSTSDVEFTAVADDLQVGSDGSETVDVFLSGANGMPVTIRFPATDETAAYTLSAPRARATVRTDGLRCSDTYQDPLRQWRPGMLTEVRLDLDFEPTAEEVPHMIAETVVLHCESQ